jgi:uncharacterized phage protein (TIGR01671 family)
MREIEFRGVRINNNEMVYGNYFHNFRKGESHNIINFNTNLWYEVNHQTVGQYTGLKDKGGIKVFEGDKFMINNKAYFVEYINDLCKYVLTTGKGYDTPNCMDLNCDTIYGLEIIGNIHENK